MNQSHSRSHSHSHSHSHRHSHGPLETRTAPSEGKSLRVLFGLVALIHLVGWGILAVATAGGEHAGTGAAISLGTGVLAYLLGLRHAFDADHIAAIDNTTRKLIGEGTRANSVGFFFALGHSSVVFVFSALLALGVTAAGSQLADENSPLRRVGALVGGTVSGSFLILIALMNIAVLVGILKVFRNLRHGTADTDTLEKHLNNRGLLSRLFRPISKTIDRPSKMYGLGILFGMGFDTATSVTMLALAGTSALTGNTSPWAIVALPIIFTAGMSLGDTLDGVFMSRAYGWVSGHPVKKAYYNVTITVISILAALGIGVPILANVAITQFSLTGGLWDLFARVNFENAGFLLVALLAGVWAAAALIWKFGRIETRWAPKPPPSPALPPT